jgi:hypothetical protein
MNGELAQVRSGGLDLKSSIDFVEDYARQWPKREKEDLDILSEWGKSVRSLIEIIVKKKLSGSMSIRSISAFKDPNVAKHLSLLHEKYVIYEWGTCTGAIRRLRFEIVNIEIMQHVFVIKIVDAIGLVKAYEIIGIE